MGCARLLLCELLWLWVSMMSAVFCVLYVKPAPATSAYTVTLLQSSSWPACPAEHKLPHSQACSSHEHSGKMAQKLVQRFHLRLHSMSGSYQSYQIDANHRQNCKLPDIFTTTSGDDSMRSQVRFATN